MGEGGGRYTQHPGNLLLLVVMWITRGRQTRHSPIPELKSKQNITQQQWTVPSLLLLPWPAYVAVSMFGTPLGEKKKKRCTKEQSDLSLSLAISLSSSLSLSLSLSLLQSPHTNTQHINHNISFLSRQSHNPEPLSGMKRGKKKQVPAQITDVNADEGILPPMRRGKDRETRLRM